MMQVTLHGVRSKRHKNTQENGLKECKVKTREMSGTEAINQAIVHAAVEEAKAAVLVLSEGGRGQNINAK